MLLLNNLSAKIRKCTICKEQVINIPQPGYFSGSILLIFQNPAIPINHKWQDELLKNNLLPIEEVNKAYLSTIQNSKLGNFINDLNLNWEDISIANLTKCPTFNNAPPNNIVVDNCLSFTLKQIEILKPKLIILNGALPKQNLFDTLVKRYKVLCFMHYAFLKRSGVYDEYVARYKADIEKSR